MQIIPAIDLRGGQCVRLRQGDYGRETVFDADPVAVARRWTGQGAQRLHVVDLDGAKAGAPVNIDVIRQVVEAISIPLQVGGGIRDDESVRAMLEEVGVDRVIIGTAALKRPDWFREIVERHPDRVALGLDARDSMVATEGWLDVSQTPAIDLARQFRGLPVAAVIYTNIANDGMMQGIDDNTLADLMELATLSFPVIASGGVSSLDDVRRLASLARQDNHLVGAIIGRALYENAIVLDEAIEVVRLSR